MEYELYVSGIGGQGVQLLSKVLALAGMAEGRHAMLAGEYGFMMRGGSSLATVVLGNGPLRALPVIAQARAALVLHHLYWAAPMARLRPGALVVADRAMADHLPAMPAQRVVLVGASEIAAEIGNPMVAGLALLSAFTAITGLVDVESLVAAMTEVVPPYRRQHVETNERAIRAGAGATGGLRLPVDLDEVVAA